MKILVTGGAGFIGSNLIRYYLNSQEHSILNVDKLCYSGSRYTVADFNQNPNYQFIHQDIVDKQAMMAILSDYQPEAILHLAAESHVDRSIDSPEAFLQSNVQGTFSLLESFRDYYRNCEPGRAQLLRFIQVSTDEVYGSLAADADAVDEQYAYQPNSPYAASKAAADHLVRAWHVTYSLPLITTHCCNNYGAYQFPEKLIPLTINKALNGEQIPVYGDGSNVREWIHVDDHVRAIDSVLKNGRVGQRYNIGSGHECSNLDLVYNICDILQELRPIKGAYRDLIRFVTDRPGHDYRYALDSSKIQSELGWSAKEALNLGLRRTINWYLQNQDWCEKVCADEYDGRRLGLVAS